MRIERRFRGPDESANGGYASGLFAQLVDGDAEVTLWSPPPLETELRVDSLNIYAPARAVGRAAGARAEDSGFGGGDRDTLVAEVRPTTVELDVPQPPSHVEAGEPDPHHPFPHCFVCGPARTDGLGLRPRRYGPLVAAPWVPGAVRPEFVWAALDCPGAFAVDPDLSRGATVLGRLAVHIEALPEPGDELVVVGWALPGGEGRRSYAGTSLFRGNEPLAWGRATWFTLQEPLPSAE